MFARCHHKFAAIDLCMFTSVHGMCYCWSRHRASANGKVAYVSYPFQQAAICPICCSLCSLTAELRRLPADSDLRTPWQLPHIALLLINLDAKQLINIGLHEQQPGAEWGMQCLQHSGASLLGTATVTGGCSQQAILHIPARWPELVGCPLPGQIAHCTGTQGQLPAAEPLPASDAQCPPAGPPQLQQRPLPPARMLASGPCHINVSNVAA